MSSLGGTVEKRTKAQVVAAGPSNQSPITITNSTPLCMDIKDTAGEKKYISAPLLCSHNAIMHLLN